MTHLGKDELAYIANLYIESMIFAKRLDFKRIYGQLLVLCNCDIRYANKYMAYLYFYRYKVWHRRTITSKDKFSHDKHCHLYPHSFFRNSKWDCYEDLFMMLSWSIVECQRFRFKDHDRTSVMFANKTISCLIGFILKNDVSDQPFFVHVENAWLYTQDRQMYTVCPVFQRRYS